MIKLLAFFFVFPFCFTLQAGTVERKVTMIQAGHGYTPENVYFLVKVDGPRVEKPECALDDRMAINPATEAGKTMFSMLLAAHAAKQSIELFGDGTCTIMASHFENISYMRVK